VRFDYLVIFAAVIMKKGTKKIPSVRTKGFLLLIYGGCYNVFRSKGTIFK